MSRFQLVTAVLLSVFLAVNAQDACNGNLVEALLQCANSIRANDSLSVQQQKCSASNGCNYDCPSSNRLDSVDSQLATLSTTLQQVMDQQAASAATLQQVMDQQADSAATLQQVMDQQADSAAATNASIQNIQSSISTIKMTYQQAQVTVNASINGLQSSLDMVRTDQGALQDAVANNTYDIAELKDHFRNLCGSTGWTRVAYLDMTHPSQSCPSAFEEINKNGVRACQRVAHNGGSCDSLTFSTLSLNYTEVCGRVLAYQYKSTDAVYVQSNNINSYYVDGVSITRGSPRQHVWTFMGGLSEMRSDSFSCPCNDGSDVNVPSFIGSDYFCESGNPVVSFPNTLLLNDPLWDGVNCGGLEGSCCTVTGQNLPWFHKVLDASTTDYLELRLCGSYLPSTEDTPVTQYEIFIK